MCVFRRSILIHFNISSESVTSDYHLQLLFFKRWSYLSGWFEVYSLVSWLLSWTFTNRPGCSHHRWHWRTGIYCIQERQVKVSSLHIWVYFLVCVFSRVSALYFTSANISLFERLSLRKDSDSAFVILWDELMRGQHRSCYTVTHQGHMSARVRKGRNLQLYYHPWWNKDRYNLSVTSVVILCTPVWGVWVWLGWQWTPFILLLLKKCSHLLLIPKPSLSSCAGHLSSSRIIVAVWRIMKEMSPCLAAKSTMSLSCLADSSVHKKH